MLKKEYFFISIRGSKGSYILAMTPEEIKMSELFCVHEGTVVLVSCSENKNVCERTKDFTSVQLWSDIQSSVMGVLESSILQGLAEIRKKK